MSGSKTLRNETGYPVQVILDVRKGSDPKDHLTNVDVSLDAGETKTVQYGDDANPYLNGVRYEYDANGVMVRIMQQVTSRGSAWDDTMNTNSTLTLHAMSEPVQGSN